MRIIGGAKRGLKLHTPDGIHTRPTSNKGRESLINILINNIEFYNHIIGGHIADVFAGSGAVGLEMLSRGAKHCVFYEHNRTALQTLNTNIQRFNADICTVKHDALNPKKNDCINGQYDCIFLDAPYTDPPLTHNAIKAFIAVGLIGNNSLIIVQIAQQDTPPNIQNFTCIKHRKISGGYIYFYKGF